MKRRTMLYFGSFNPVHRGHIALAEYVLDNGLCDSVVLVVSPQNPTKDESMLLPEFVRFEMAEIACQESKYPDAIQASAIEFLLPKPSYTINTLRFLSENNGAEMEFSILMGADNVENFDKWREYESILEICDIYVYPRSGYTADGLGDRMHYLADAPLFDCSSTEIRNAIARGTDVSDKLSAGVAEYIKTNHLTEALKNSEVEHLKAEGREHYRRNEWGKALNAFRKALTLDCDDTEADQYIKMIEEILEFRYKDIYNP